MEKTSLGKDIKVGIFTFIGVVVFCVSVILLGGGTWLFTSSYTLKVRLPQVSGLNSGSVVSLTGVPIGNVTALTFIEGGTDVEVTMKLDQSFQNRITEGSMASVKTQGALGDKYIYITPGAAGGAPLKDGGMVATDSTPDFLDLIAQKGSEMGEIVSVIKEVRVLFENINRDQKSAQLMSNMVSASGEFAKFMGEARETFKIMRNDALLPMASVMKKLDNGHGTLGALINDPSLYTRINAFFGEQPRNSFLKPLMRDSIQTHEQKK
ncbi:MAG TPA: MlaD family protein [Bdellovibrionales bacterium]|nr:MlaD family protein [Bdellovibrionales bacterium]